MMNKNLLLSFFVGTTLVASLASAEGFSVKTWSKGLDATTKKSIDFAQIEKGLFSEKNSDLQAIVKARDLFSKGQFEAAITAYDLVPKGSSYWLEAIEEKGWAYHRKGDLNKALAQTKTLLSDQFLPIVGTEAFFLQSLSQLKICDYKGVLETNQLFKDSQRTRVIAIQKLSKEGTNSALQNVIEKADSFPLSLTNIGEDLKTLPNLFYRDVEFQKSLLEVKLNRAAGLESKASQALNRLQTRIKVLAKRETQENSKILQKLNLIEVETIQRIHTDLHVDKNSYQKGEFAKVDEDHLVFPDDGRPWMDELDKYQVKLNSCPHNIRRKM